MTRALTCPETVHHRPHMTREIETWLSDSRVGNNSVVDHKSRRPVLSPLRIIVSTDVMSRSKIRDYLKQSFCKQNLLPFIQPRWQLRRTYFFNHYNVLFYEFAFTVQVKHEINSTQILGFILICLYFTTGHFHTCVLCKECGVAYFSCNSWLSFQRLCRLVWGYATSIGL